MTTFTYSFPTTAPIAGQLRPFVGQSALNTITQYPLNFGLTQAFNIWGNVANLSYLQGATGNHINFAYWNTSSNGLGTTLGVDINGTTSFNSATNFWIFLNKFTDINDPSGPADFMITSPTIYNWGVWDIAHEIGHTLLGDKHPTDTMTPPTTNDLRFSIMNNPNAHITLGITLPNDYSNPSQPTLPKLPIPLTPGMNDISLVQNGGTNPLNGKLVTAHGVSTAQDGNTNYTFTENSVTLGGLNSTSATGDPEKYVMTLWDRAGTAGGIDTIDASAMTTKVYINLSPGEFSSIGSDIGTQPTGANLGGSGSPDGDTKWNVGIALGAQIENAKGGGGNDLILGNTLVNTLEGNGGADTLWGGAGGDLLVGGSGNDILQGGTASNWLTGGTDKDAFYLDVDRGANNNNSTWSTISDFNKAAGETATLWGWQANSNQSFATTNIGSAQSPTGASYYFDLDNDVNHVVDTAITFTGLTLAQVGTPTMGFLANGQGYILFG